MIAGIFHQGSGIGNQLHRYAATRCLALDKGYEWGMMNPELNKATFMNLDMGKKLEGAFSMWGEKKTVNDDGWDVREYDPSILTVEDQTIIDGEFQDPKYFMHHIDEVREWLKVEPLEMTEDVCVIGFRGGEYVGVPGLFLPGSYWQQGIEKMLAINPDMRFEVHTDDVATAQLMFPYYTCIHNPALNWRSVRYAKHLIIANSSFFIFPALLGDAREIIAPEFWAGYNKGYWQLPQNNYERFTYI